MAKQAAAEGNERERWELERDDLSRIINQVRAVRRADGKWFIQFEMNGEISIDDDRDVLLQRHVSLHGEQLGRKKREVKAEKGKKGFGE